MAMSRGLFLCVLVAALALAHVGALTPNPACKTAATAKAEARAALRYYYRQKQASKWYCWHKDNRWTWKDNGNLISISTTALYTAADGCYVMLTHAHEQANIFFGGARRGPSDFQVGWKRPNNYAAANKNWNHGEVQAARFLANVDFPDANVNAYPNAERAAILALRGKVAAGTLSVAAILPDRPFCDICAGTSALYGAGGAAVNQAAGLLPIAKQAACTAHSALLGQMSAVTYASEQLTPAEKAQIDAAVKPGVKNAACCTWEAAGRPNPVPPGCDKVAGQKRTAGGAAPAGNPSPAKKARRFASLFP